MLRVEIISPTGYVFKGDSATVVIPSVLGEIGVMEGHESFLVNLGQGNIVILDEKNQIAKEFAVGNGVAQISDGKNLSILVDE